MSDSQSSQGSGEDKDCSTTLYFGNLHPYVSQKSLEDLNNYFGENQSKVIKDKASGTSACFGFVKFSEKKAAECALLALNGKCYLGHELRVNWALPNSQKEDCALHHLFVGDLQADVTDAQLYNAFCRVGQCSDARVMWDHATGRSKGYGFVSFRIKEDAENALLKMHGSQIGSRRIRCGWAQHKQDEKQIAPEYNEVDRLDPSNKNVYVGNVAPEWSELDLSTHFSVYGRIVEVKLHKKGGYGFVKFEAHASAVKAIVDTHGKGLQGRVLKCSWGKNVVSLSEGSSSPPVSASSRSMVSNLSAPMAPNFPMSSAAVAAAIGGATNGGTDIPHPRYLNGPHFNGHLMNGDALQMLVAAGALGVGGGLPMNNVVPNAYDMGSNYDAVAALSKTIPLATLQMIMMLQNMQGVGSQQPSLPPVLSSTMPMDMQSLYGSWLMDTVGGAGGLYGQHGMNSMLQHNFN